MTRLPDFYKKNTKNILSFSGGKDSTAMYLLAMEMGVDFIPVCADTGNEHQITLDYVRNFHNQTGGPAVKIICSDFSEQIMRKRQFIAKDHRKKKQRRKIKDKETGKTIGHKVVSLRYTNKQKRRILENLHPTGNSFLDLCLWKGRFPSRTAQFCTEELKRNAIIEQVCFPLIDGGYQIISWQGVRAQESHRRAQLSEYDSPGGGIFNYRPILQWDVEQVFEIMRRHKVKPNPLYTHGMGRVGCMPCINCNKKELLEISKRFPHHIDKIEEWEQLVALCSKRGAATFFHKTAIDNDMTGPEIMCVRNIRKTVEWSKTQRGGLKMDLFSVFEEPLKCFSSYGLCE